MELIKLALPNLIEGLWMTITLTTLSMLIGFSLGLVLALMRLSSIGLLSGFAKGYSIVFRGTPLLVQIILFYFRCDSPLDRLSRIVVGTGGAIRAGPGVQLPIRNLQHLRLQDSRR